MAPSLFSLYYPLYGLMQKGRVHGTKDKSSGQPKEGLFFGGGGGKSWVASNGASAVMTGKRTTTSILHMYKYIDCMPRSH